MSLAYGDPKYIAGFFRHKILRFIAKLLLYTVDPVEPGNRFGRLKHAELVFKFPMLETAWNMSKGFGDAVFFVPSLVDRAIETPEDVSHYFDREANFFWRSA